MSTYRTVCHWRPVTDLWDGQRAYTYLPEPTERHFDTLAGAEYSGMTFGCLAGTTRIEVLSPDGVLQALWDKTSPVVLLGERHYADYAEDGRGLGTPLYRDQIRVSGQWQRLGAESQALGKAQVALLRAHLHDTVTQNSRGGDR